MSKFTTAKRYAKALLEVAKEQGAIAQVKEDFAALVEAVRGNETLQMLLNHPQVELQDKKHLLTGAMQQANPLLVNFLHLMVDKGREGSLFAIYDLFAKLVDEYEGIVEATITSSTPLDAETIKQITDKFSQKLGKNVRAITQVDPTLLGGVVVRIGDRLYDGSVKGKLNRLSKSLSV